MQYRKQTPVGPESICTDPSPVGIPVLVDGLKNSIWVLAFRTGLALHVVLHGFVVETFQWTRVRFSKNLKPATPKMGDTG